MESLKKSYEFKHVFNNGRRYRAAHLGVYISSGQRNCRTQGSRVGLVVSKRVGNAVVRNRVKRLFREAMRHHAAQIDQGIPLDIVLLAGPSTPKADYKDIYNELRGVLERHNAASTAYCVEDDKPVGAKAAR